MIHRRSEAPDAARRWPAAGAADDVVLADRHVVEHQHGSVRGGSDHACRAQVDGDRGELVAVAPRGWTHDAQAPVGVLGARRRGQRAP